MMIVRQCAVFYRWHVMDPVFFDEELKVTVQQIGVGHKGLFERQDDCQVLHTGIRRNHIMFFQSFLRKKKDGQDRKGSRKVNYVKSYIITLLPIL